MFQGIPRNEILDSFSPYFFHAAHRWMNDKGYTCLISVIESIPGIVFPGGSLHEYAKNGVVYFDISDSAVSVDFLDDGLSFSAIVNGKVSPVFIPYGAIIAIFAKENEDIGFQFSIRYPAPESTPEFFSLPGHLDTDSRKPLDFPGKSDGKKKGSVNLRVVK